MPAGSAWGNDEVSDRANRRRCSSRPPLVGCRARRHGCRFVGRRILMRKNKTEVLPRYAAELCNGAVPIRESNDRPVSNAPSNPLAPWPNGLVPHCEIAPNSDPPGVGALVIDYTGEFDCSVGSGFARKVTPPYCDIFKRYQRDGRPSNPICQRTAPSVGRTEARQALSFGPSITPWLRLTPLTLVLPEIMDTHDTDRNRTRSRVRHLFPIDWIAILLMEVGISTE